MRIENWIEQYGIDDREERGVRTDTEREREDSDDGEAGAFAQRAKGEAEILEEFVEPAATPLIASDVLDERHVAEFTARSRVGVVRSRATINQVLSRHRQVRLKFVVQFFPAALV